MVTCRRRVRQRRSAVAAERNWISTAFDEHLFLGARWLDAGGHQTFDPFVALGFVAAATGTHSGCSRIWRLSVLKSVAALAKSAATWTNCPEVG